MGFVFSELTWDELCDLMCGQPEEDCEEEEETCTNASTACKKQ